MAPSAVEAPKSGAENIVPKTTPSTEATTVSKLPVGPEDVLEEEDFRVRTGHREPLKSNGLLDQYEKFEVTPVLGREYVNLKLVDILRAPNSDDLIQELALTSECASVPKALCHMLTNCSLAKSRNGVLSSSTNKMMLRTKSRKSLSNGLVSFQGSPQPRSFIYIQSTIRHEGMRRMMRLASSLRHVQNNSICDAFSAQTRLRAISRNGIPISLSSPCRAITPFSG